MMIKGVYPILLLDHMIDSSLRREANSMGKVPKASKSISHAGSIKTVNIRISSGNVKVHR